MLSSIRFNFKYIILESLGVGTECLMHELLIMKYNVEETLDPD